MTVALLTSVVKSARAKILSIGIVSNLFRNVNTIGNFNLRLLGSLGRTSWTPYNTLCHCVDALTRSHPVSAKIAYPNQSDLWVAQTKEARINKVLSDDVDVKTVMESWTLQNGYPGITVTRN